MTQTLLDRTKNDNDAICRHLGIDDQGHCLRHPNQTILGRVDKHRFETIHVCIICDSELRAGGRRQRRQSWVQVTNALASLTENKQDWNDRTKIMHYGKPLEVNETEEETKSQHGDSSESEVSRDSFTHALEFYDGNREVSEDDIAKWKEGVSVRVGHVRAWDQNSALKFNPMYAKYFRMKNVGKYETQSWSL